MNYEEAINFIHSIPKFRRPLGNENLARLLGLLGNPQKKLRFVHIAGTNGKGSAAAMTAEILKRAGYKTGLFTSPYIEVFNERICVCGKNIPDNLLIETYDWLPLTELDADGVQGQHNGKNYLAYTFYLSFLRLWFSAPAWSQK